MTHPMDHAAAKAMLERWFQAAVAAVGAEAAMRSALIATPVPTEAPALLAIGKAAPGMIQAAVEWLAGHGLEPAAGLLISHRDVAAPHPNIAVAIGDHPVPGAGSLAASAQLATFVADLPATTPVWVLLSGGASALIASPRQGITAVELRDAFDTLHHLGLDIHAMNAVRRRLTQWGGGRLAASLAPRPVATWVISDVIGNDPATIGSGPLVSGEADHDLLQRVIADTPMLQRLSRAAAALLVTDDVAGVPAIDHRIIADGRMAAEAVVQAASLENVSVTMHQEPLTGDAVLAGATVARALAAAATVPGRIEAQVWWGETTVSLPPSPGKGGRAQQLALATAARLHRDWPARRAVVLAAGTDGRDGPTDAAGAVVDDTTVDRLEQLGVVVDDVLARADAYPALDRIGALYRSGVTGTNVADLVIAATW